ncbi:albusnodin/ikarugamycin family macrolactam cyclase [Kitasatospora sp. NPDC094011]|uniref:albusnodin/ikarugamycin family macrolactam cyclase n=1 Tax=Kitasatospora sp. NPDC094011 TaxID=3364090 RepID=UPI00382BA276
MSLFGGSLARSAAPSVPVGAQVLWRRPSLWSDGAAVRSANGAGGRRLAVFGPCAATDAELTRLAHADDPQALDRAASAWAGAYTLVLDDGYGVFTVWADPAGACPVYTSLLVGAPVWASSSAALAGLLGAEPDTAWLAAHLAAPTRWVPGRSAWTGVEQIPPGHRWSASATGAHSYTPYWQAPELSWEHAVRRLRADLADGVLIRVSGRAASCDLSGGLDSSTLAALAAQCGPVTGLTYHPKGRDSGGDIDHARAVAKAFPAIRHRFMALGPEHLPFADLGGLPPTDEPAPSAMVHAQLGSQLDLLRTEGVEVHLTGDGGDSLFMPPPVHMADLARSGRLVRLAGDAQAWARLYRASPWTALSAACNAPDKLGGTTASRPWLTRYACDLADAVTTPYGDAIDLGHADRHLLEEARYVGRSAATENQLAAAHGIEMHNPFTDARIVETVLAVPAPERWSARRYKPLLTDTVTRLLPPGVLQRGAKGVFVADHHHGLRANRAAVMDLTGGYLADLGLIHPAALRSLLGSAALGVDIPWGLLEPVLGTELWLRSSESSGRTLRWEEAP